MSQWVGEGEELSSCKSSSFHADGSSRQKLGDQFLHRPDSLFSPHPMGHQLALASVRAPDLEYSHRVRVLFTWGTKSAIAPR